MKEKLIMTVCLFVMVIINLIYAILLAIVSFVFSFLIIFSFSEKSLKTIDFYQNLIPKLPNFSQNK
jgi:MFS superfamily sulfate permease-like transporter